MYTAILWISKQKGKKSRRSKLHLQGSQPVSTKCHVRFGNRFPLYVDLRPHDIGNNDRLCKNCKRKAGIR